MIRRIRLVSVATSKPKIRRLAAGREQERRQDLDQRRLAGAVGPEQPEELARRDLEVDAVERDDGLRLRRRRRAGPRSRRWPAAGSGWGARRTWSADADLVRGGGCYHGGTATWKMDVLHARYGCRTCSPAHADALERSRSAGRHRRLSPIGVARPPRPVRRRRDGALDVPQARRSHQPRDCSIQAQSWPRPPDLDRRPPPMFATQTVKPFSVRIRPFARIQYRRHARALEPRPTARRRLPHQARPAADLRGDRPGDRRRRLRVRGSPGGRRRVTRSLAPRTPARSPGRRLGA